MQQPIVIIGMGEMGGVFARAFLKNGYPVYPALRDSDLADLSREIDNPALVLVATGEADLAPTLEQIPALWLDKLVLLQNELLPRDWQHLASPPTVISVWFEKKPGQDFKVLVSSPAFGPVSEILVKSLQKLGIAAHQLASANDLLFELVVKNLYILSTNLCGLRSGGSVAELREQHSELLNQVFDEILLLQYALIGTDNLRREALFEAMLKAFDGDPAHKCMGRSAPARLQRALQLAEQYGLELPNLKQIAAELEA